MQHTCRDVRAVTIYRYVRVTLSSQDPSSAVTIVSRSDSPAGPGSPTGRYYCVTLFSQGPSPAVTIVSHSSARVPRWPLLSCHVPARGCDGGVMNV
eukprot:1191797-Prorocentrum_minimum.AAC.2